MDAQLWSTSSRLVQQNATAISTIIATLGLGVFASYFYYQNAFSYWRRRGVKGPSPRFLFGNAKEMFKENREKLEEQWLKAYGKIYGIYLGTKPRLVIADLDVVNQICIKDFENFTDHEGSEFFNKYQKSFLVFLKGDHWKKVRAFMSPTFTSGKMKRMHKMMEVCANDLVECVHEERERNGQAQWAVLDAKDLFNLFTMDAITTCCYSLKLERANSANLKASASRNEFVRIALRLFEFNFARLVAASTLPKSLLRLLKFEIMPESKVDPLIKIVEKMIEKRRSEPNSKKHADYLQSLIDAKIDDKMEVSEADVAENHHAGLTGESILRDQQTIVEQVKGVGEGDKKKSIELTDVEMITQAAFIILVGLETTGNLLCSCSYFLSHEPEVQDRLVGELRKIANEDGSFDYEALTSCKYLDAVICETLRMFTPAMATERLVNNDYYIEKYNLHIPKGMSLQIPLHAIMMDPENFEEPTKFDPERFLPGRRETIKAGSYCPFGLGPRHCVGMRFSLAESKMALARMLMSFRFEPAPNSKYPPDSAFISGVLRCVKDPRIKFVVRT